MGPPWAGDTDPTVVILRGKGGLSEPGLGDKCLSNRIKEEVSFSGMFSDSGAERALARQDVRTRPRETIVGTVRH